MRTITESIVGRTLGRVLLYGAITIGVFLLVEGSASFLIFLRVLQTRQENASLREASHTDFDPVLGWVNQKGRRFEDFYGLGKHLVLNNQGFRDDEDFTRSVPPNVRRVICSGDSFTLGHGVGNDDTWCAILELLNPGVQTVNMGQGGYGLDQAYLWYMRDGLALEHHAQIFAFIEDDFRRLGLKQFLGYGKPKLVVEAGELRVEPARRYSRQRRWLALNGRLFGELRSVDLLDRVLRRLGIGKLPLGAWRADGATKRLHSWEIAEAIFDHLAEEHWARGTDLELVLLPTVWDHDGELSTTWRRLLSDYSARTGVPFVDLVAEYKAMSKEDADALFIPIGEPGQLHLNEVGNRWVAERLTEHGLVLRLGPQAPTCR